MASRKKIRIPMPLALAAEVVFLSDRTCCVCRNGGRPTQIHHLDEDPAHNVLDNLALLCLDCHDATQVSGGFGQGLSEPIVRLYREDWYRLVADRRASNSAPLASPRGPDISLITSLVEIYRSNGQLELLTMFYNAIGNAELRDRCVDEILAEGAEDSAVVFYRGLQGHPELIPEDVITREEKRLIAGARSNDLARLYGTLGWTTKAVNSYAQVALETIAEGNPFSAAYYLKEMVDEGLIADLFKVALDKFADEGDLHWQMRCLEELGWTGALDDWALAHAGEIEATGEMSLLEALARARGDDAALAEIQKLEAQTQFAIGEGVAGPRGIDDARRLAAKERSSLGTAAQT